MIKYLISIFFSLFVFESNGQSPSTQTCDTIHFNNADTSQVFVTDYALADTTATLLFGQIVDRKDFTPVGNVEITLRYGANVHTTVTDKYGKFKLDCFLGDDSKNYVIYISHTYYGCLKIVDAINANLIGLRVKLKRLHA